MSRTCYICLVDQPEDQVVEAEWVSPCRCTGSVAWVHKACILRWVHVQERRNPDEIRCTACGTPFILTPELGPVFKAIGFLDKYIFPCCKLYVFIVMGSLFCDTGFILGGIYTLTQVYGVEEALKMIQGKDLIVSVSELHLFSYGLLLLSYLPLDYFLLRVLQRGSRLPVLGRVLPTDVPQRYRLEGRIERPYEYECSTVVTALLLPVLSATAGRLFFKSVDSDLKRFLLGGTVVLTLKSLVKMYFWQKQMTRRKNMRILPYVPPPSAGNQT